MKLPQPPSDIPEPVRSELLTLAEEVANAFCNRAAPCCSSLDARLGSNCVTYSSVVWAAANIAKGPASPDATVEYAFDETHAAACREQLTQLESGCGFEFARSNAYDVTAFSLLEAYCMASLSVTISGERWQCLNDSDCIAYNDAFKCEHGQCVDPATCQTLDPDAGTGACAPELALDAACSTSDGPPCAAGLTCKNDHCSTLPAEGEACADVMDCEAGMHCVPNAPGDPSGTCQALGPRGQVPCAESWQCNHECVAGYCDPREDTFCLSPY